MKARIRVYLFYVLLLNGQLVICDHKSAKKKPNKVGYELSHLDLEARDARTLFDPKDSFIEKIEDRYILTGRDFSQLIILPYKHDYHIDKGILYKIALATSDFTLIGQVKVFICDAKSKEPYGFIALLKIEPEFYRQGHAKRLLKEAYKLIQKNNLSKVTLRLWKGKENVPALRLYESEGFVHDSSITKVYVMTKILENSN